MNDNFIIHIHLYLKDKDSENMALDNIKSLKENGFNIMITSPKVLPDSFYPFIDIFYHDKENQLLKQDYISENFVNWWYAVDQLTMNFITIEKQTHGLAVLRSMIKGCKLAKMSDIKWIIRFEFDDFFGPSSILKIHEFMNDIEKNDIDFLVFRNIYSEEKSHDISVHFMIYKAESFLDIFGWINNEDDYRIGLKSIGMDNKFINLEIYLYRFLKDFVNLFHIKWYDGIKMKSLLFDSRFNQKITPSVEDGTLSDVMRIKNVDGSWEDNRIYLGAQDEGGENDVLFKVYYRDGKEYEHISRISTYGTWNLFELEYSNIDFVIIHHLKSNLIKKIEFDNIENIRSYVQKNFM